MKTMSRSDRVLHYVLRGLLWLFCSIHADYEWCDGCKCFTPPERPCRCP